MTEKLTLRMTEKLTLRMTERSAAQLNRFAVARHVQHTASQYAAIKRGQIGI